MGTHIAFDIEAEDKLSRVRWTFWFHERVHKLVLDGYYEESRPTKRHGYKVGRRYVRLGREATIREDQVPITNEIKRRALVEFVRGLEVVLWSTVSEGR
jgi:hypothetical protein